MTTNRKDLEEIRDIALGYINLVVSDIAAYQDQEQKTKSFSPELASQVKANCAKRVEGSLAHLNKTIERFNTTALGVFGQSSNKETDHGR